MSTIYDNNTNMKSEEYYKFFDDCANKYHWNKQELSNGSCIYKFGHGPRIAILSGVHGNEISGPYAIMDMIRNDYSFLIEQKYEFWILPLLNTKGWDLKKRNCGRYNLNRQFKKNSKTITKEAMESLEEKVPVCLIDLHEDDMTRGNYIWDYANDKSGLSKHVAKVLNVDTFEWKDNYYGKEKMSSDEYAINLRVPATMTTETDPYGEIRERIAFQKECLSEGVKYIARNY